ncbi:MAG: hypothetical protein K9G75_10595, partial [Candidatus Nanopelagicales bacterium]|nr:hypothetical protein [Candidatus Nanopelagicales bacterium]
MSEPLWTPDLDELPNARMSRFRRAAQMRVGDSFPSTVELHRWSITEPDAFWSLVWDEFTVAGEKGARSYVPSTLPEAVFFPEARINLAENLLAPWRDSDEVAVVCVGEGADDLEIRSELTGRELSRRVGSFAQALRDHGIRPGDRVGL